MPPPLPPEAASPPPHATPGTDTPHGAALYSSLSTALTRSDVIDVEDAPFSCPSEGIIVAEVDEAGGCVVGLPPGALRRIGAECMRRDARGEQVDPSVLLVVHPDAPKGWAALRREVVRTGDCRRGYDLSRMAIRRKPKSSGAWSFRSWLALRDVNGPAFDTELDLALLACDRYTRNYYAWGHIHDICAAPTTTSPQRLGALPLLREFSKSRPSDHSALSAVQAILLHTASLCGGGGRCGGGSSSIAGEDGKSALVELLLAERVEAVSLLAKRPAHESVWMHARFATMMLWEHVSAEAAADALVEILRGNLPGSNFSCGGGAPAPATDSLAERDARATLKWAEGYARWVGLNSPPELLALLPADLKGFVGEAVGGGGEE